MALDPEAKPWKRFIAHSALNTKRCDWRAGEVGQPMKEEGRLLEAKDIIEKWTEKVQQLRKKQGRSLLC